MAVVVRELKIPYAIWKYGMTSALRPSVTGRYFISDQKEAGISFPGKPVNKSAHIMIL
jgi:hypothetical protein